MEVPQSPATHSVSENSNPDREIDWYPRSDSEAPGACFRRPSPRAGRQAVARLPSPFPRSWIETEWLGWMNRQPVEVCVRRIEDEDAFVRDDRRRYRQDDGCRRSQPALTKQRKGWRRRKRPPIRQQVRNGYCFDCEIGSISTAIATSSSGSRSGSV